MTTSVQFEGKSGVPFLSEGETLANCCHDEKDVLHTRSFHANRLYVTHLRPSGLCAFRCLRV